MTKKSSATSGPLLINETSLSKAWAKVFLHAIDNVGEEITPLILSVTGFSSDGEPAEDTPLRAALDTVLIALNHLNVSDVAFTIFPQRLWKLAQGNRSMLFKIYKDAFPRYQAINPSANRRGLYFERLISYGRGRCDGNQLEWLLSQFESRLGVRHSMYQASIFDPERDHIPDARLRFPCLQHISFEPTSAGLVINAFYATQQILIKGYGNYLGLTQLGAFIAHEMKIPLLRVNVCVGVAKLGVAKTDDTFTGLIAAARASVNESTEKTQVLLRSTYATDAMK
jgi:hypothetical protein